MQNKILRNTVITSLCVLIVMTGVGFWGILQVESEIKTNLRNQLTASLSSTVKIVNNWIRERQISLESTAAVSVVRKNIISLVEKTSGKKLTKTKLLNLPEQKWLRSHLGRITRKYDFTGFVIFDTSGRQVSALLDEAVGRQDLLGLSDFVQRALKGNTVISTPFASEIPLPDVHGHIRKAWPTMFVATPIRDEMQQVVAVLSFRLRPESGFSSLLTARPGTSGETYAFDRQGRLLSKSRFEDQLKSIGLMPNTAESTSILSLEIRDPGEDMTQGIVPKIPRSEQPLTLMAQSAISGKTAWNVDGYNDYRGVPVVGAWTWLDEFQFGITHEIDTKEALTPLTVLKKTFYILFAMLLCVTSLGLIQYYRKQQAEKQQALEHKQTEAISQRMESIFNNTIDPIIIIDDEGIIESFNPAAEKAFGHTQEEIIGQNVNVLMPQPYASEHDEHLKNYKLTGQSNIIGSIREVEGIHKDGNTFFIELAVSEFQTEAGKKFIGSIRDITERKVFENKIDTARRDAEKANKAKSEFLSQMSHELRTPLNAILGFAQIMEVEMDTMELSYRMECVERILNGGQHLLQLINDVLDLSRVETGNLSVSMEATEVSPLIEEVLTLSNPLAKTNKIELINSVSGNVHYTVHADRMRLRQVMLNLVSNAIKYNRPEGTVTISCEPREENCLRISVTDTGEGIPEEQYPLLFQPFSRLENEDTYIEGTGIGLNICQKLVDLMGGEINMTSEVGTGSVFFVDLKLIKESIPVQKEKEITVPRPPKAAAQGTDLRILYIEDNPTNIDLVTRILHKHWPSVDLLTTQNGHEGLTLAETRQPTLILLDLHLPKISGWEIFERLQLSSATRNIPVVAVSANAMRSDIKRTLKMGFERYLTKPIVLDEFLEMLNHHLGASSLSPENVEPNNEKPSGKHTS